MDSIDPAECLESAEDQQEEPVSDGVKRFPTLGRLAILQQLRSTDAAEESPEVQPESEKPEAEMPEIQAEPVQESEQDLEPELPAPAEEKREEPAGPVSAGAPQQPAASPEQAGGPAAAPAGKFGAESERAAESAAVSACKIAAETEQNGGPAAASAGKIGAESEPVRDADAEPLHNTRLASVVRLQEAAARQAEQERERRARLEQEQRYLEKLLQDVETNLQESSADREFNDQFEAQLRSQVYSMHGVSGDRLEGMTQSRQAWYRGAASSLFLLSVLLFVFCGVIHGFDAQLTLFVAFYMGVQGALLAARHTQFRLLDILLKILYVLLFPASMVIFTCYELGFTAYYNMLLPAFTVAGVVILVIAAFSYFGFDYYHETRKVCQSAERYMRKLEKAARKELRMQQKEKNGRRGK